MLAPDAPRPTFADLIRPGVDGVRRNWPAMLGIQGVALLLVLGYFFVPPVTRFCAWLSDVRGATGYAGAAVATVVAGVFIPMLARRLARIARQSRVGLREEIVFLSVLFALNGVLVDGFYRLLADWFGTGNAWANVLPKVAVDMLGFTPFVALPAIALAFTLRDHRYRPGPTLREVGWRWYVRRVVTLMLPGWCYWTPMVLMIYSLPTPLQFVLFTFAMAAWSLVMVFIGEAGREPQQVATAL